MRLIGNILWFIFCGIWLWLINVIAGIILCITIIGIPFGLQAFKFAKLGIAPFGKKVDIDFAEHPIANLIWAIFFGWEQALFYFFAGIICFVTIIAIPIAFQLFKFAKLSLMPFGADIN